MQTLLAAAALASLLVLGSAAAHDYDNLLILAQANPMAAFDQFARQHGKPYLEDKAEYRQRFGIFQANLARIAQHNARNGVSYWLGLNEFADLTTEEFRLRMFGENPSDLLELRARNAAQNEKLPKADPWPYGNETPAKRVNWVEEGLITAVKNQHVNNSPCGCCYAFGGMAGVEAANALYTGVAVSLSEQEIVDCDFLDYGCDGGDFFNVFRWVQANGGVDDDTDYPYLAKETSCLSKKARRNKRVTINGFVWVPPTNETALEVALTHTPTSTGVCCGQYIDQWHLYKGGIFDESVHCAEPIDHAMLIVGYDTDTTTGTDYWLVKNSWGSTWGEEGYIRFKRNVADPRAQSGLASFPAYAFKNSPNPKHSAQAARAHLADGMTTLTNWVNSWFNSAERA